MSPTTDRAEIEARSGGMVWVLPLIDAKMSAEPTPLDGECVVLLRLRAAYHDRGVTYE